MIRVVEIKGERFIPAEEFIEYFNKVNLLENDYYDRKITQSKIKLNLKYKIDIKTDNDYVRIMKNNKVIHSEYVKGLKGIYEMLSNPQIETIIKAKLYDMREEKKNE